MAGKKLKLSIYSIEILGLVLAIFLVGLMLGVEIGSYRPELTPFGYTTPTHLDLLFRFTGFSIFFLSAIVLLWMRDNLVLKAGGLIPLILIIHQAWIMIQVDLRGGLPGLITKYSTYTGILAYAGHFFLVLAITLLILNVTLIRQINHSSIETPKL